MSITKVELKINCTNDAFKPMADVEVARILNEISNKLYTGEQLKNMQIRDINGNKVGFLVVEADDEEDTVAA